MTSFGKALPAGFGRVRWRRFAIILAPAIALVVLLFVLTAQSVLAVSVSISGKPFTVTARLLKGQGFEQFGVIDHSIVANLPGRTNHIVLAATAMKSATITHLCQVVDVLGVPMVITAGTANSPAVASDLVVYADRFSGNASFRHLTLGKDASTLKSVPGIRGPAGAFALSATKVTISNLRQHAFATTAGTFTLPNFRLHFGGGC